MKDARGLLEHNDIYGNEHAGVGVETGAAPTIRLNRIHDGLQAGAFFFDGGMGTFEENDVFGNDEAGVQIIEGSDPTIARNTLRRQALPKGEDHERSKDVAPLWVHSGGRGNVQDNEICGSLWHGVSIGSQAEPLLQGNRIHSNRKSGVFMMDAAAPTLLENEIQKNWIGVECARRPLPKSRLGEVRRGSARLGEVYPRRRAPFPHRCIEQADPTLRGNKIHHSRMGGIWVYKGARGTYEDNEIYQNAKAGVRVWDLGDPTMQRNKIWGGKTTGVLVYECGKGHWVRGGSSRRGWRAAARGTQCGAPPLPRPRRTHHPKEVLLPSLHPH